MESELDVVVTTGIQIQFSMLDEVGHELDDVNHPRRACVLEQRPRDGRTRLIEEIRGTIHGVHILMENPPHVAALSAKNPLHTQAFGLSVNLGVEALDGLV